MRRIVLLALALSLALSASCHDNAVDRVSSGATGRGGTYRVAATFFGFPCDLDPVCEYYTASWNLHQILLRPLMGYKHMAGAEGSAVVPDLAESVSVSADGTVYTFKLKTAYFGPPVNRRITSRDFLYAFRRLATNGLSEGGYSFYYVDVIQGFAPQDQMPASIAGIATPSDDTIVFTLTQPTGDFLYLLSMPATAPVPEEVAGCFGDRGEYGRRLVSSGPYMIQGSDNLDISSCERIRPMSGFNPRSQLRLVRNPSYSAATQAQDPYRQNNVDGIHITKIDDVDEIYAEIAAGKLEGGFFEPPPPAVLDAYQGSDRVHIHQSDAVRYISLNLTQPPFDDVHVRRAVNYAVDKAALQELRGGERYAAIATRIVPPSMTAGQPVGYDPYATSGSDGDVEQAKAEMRLSRYDHDGDGICDAPECQHVVNVNDENEPYGEQAVSLANRLSAIGITMETQAVPRDVAYGMANDLSLGIEMASFPAWGKDYPDANTFDLPLFHSNAIGNGQPGSGCCNYSAVGITPELAQELGIPGNVANVPSVDADIAQCAALLGDERIQCWIALDRKLMEEVVPWVPYAFDNAVEIVGPAVSQYEFDQFSAGTSFARVAVDRSKQR